MFDTSLDNELMTSDTGFENSVMAAEQEEQSTRTGSFQGTTYQDVLDWYEATGFGDRNPSDPSTYPNVVGSSYIVGEDGGYYNEAGEKLYWFDPPSELGRGGQSSLGDADNKGFYTEAQIRSYWDADQGMGYFKKANPDLTYEAYMGYLSERQTLVESGDIAKLDGDELYRQGHKGRGPNADAINAIVLEERQRVNEQNAQLTSDLASKYGIQQAYQNSDGDVFRFNGSNYHKAFKVDDHDWSKVIGNIVVDFAIGMITGQLANALIGFVSPGQTIDSLIKGAASKFGVSIPDFIDMAKVAGGVSTASSGYGEWNDIINSPEWSNVIVNLAGAGGPNSGGPDMTPPAEDINDDGTRTYGSFNLPPGYIYNDARGVVIHEETGEEYPVTYTLFGSEGSPYNWIVDLPADGDTGGSGATAGEDASPTVETPATTNPSSDTAGSSGGSPNAGGDNPNTTVISNGTYGDQEIVTNPDVWNKDGTYGGWEVISNTGVWGQSGISVIRNVASGMYQEIDWDNGTYNQEMQNNPDDNPFDTSGSNQGEGQGDDTESTASGPATGPTTETPTTEPTVDYPDDGSACWLSDGTIGAKKSGECVPTSDPFKDIIGWPYVLPSEPYKPDTPPVDPADPNASTSTDPSTDTSTTSADTSGGSTDNNGGTDSNGTAGQDGSNTGGENGTGENGNNGSGDGGDGTGDGNGNGPSNPNQFIDGGGGISEATWTPLYGQPKFRSRFREFQRGMFAPRGNQSSISIPQDYSNYRMGLLSQAYKDLA